MAEGWSLARRRRSLSLPTIRRSPSLEMIHNFRPSAPGSHRADRDSRIDASGMPHNSPKVSGVKTLHGSTVGAAVSAIGGCMTG